MSSTEKRNKNCALFPWNPAFPYLNGSERVYFMPRPNRNVVPPIIFISKRFHSQAFPNENTFFAGPSRGNSRKLGIRSVTLHLLAGLSPRPDDFFRFLFPFYLATMNYVKQDGSGFSDQFIGFHIDNCFDVGLFHFIAKTDLRILRMAFLLLSNGCS